MKMNKGVVLGLKRRGKTSFGVLNLKQDGQKKQEDCG